MALGGLRRVVYKLRVGQTLMGDVSPTKWNQQQLCGWDITRGKLCETIGQTSRNRELGLLITV